MPRDFRQEADLALKAWHGRTLRIAELLAVNQIDKALSLCPKQRAAFANFRALDPLVINKDPQWIDRLKEIFALSEDIQRQLDELHLSNEDSLASIRREKKRISRFHSNTEGPNHLSKTLVASI